MIILGAVAGACAGASLLLLTHVAPWFAKQNVIRDVDDPRVFGKKISRREAHLVGVTVHVISATMFGTIYGYLVREHFAPGFEFIPLLGWGGVLWLFLGGVVMPLEGHGIFGVNEDSWFPVDLMITSLLWACLYWIFINVWLALG